MDISAVIKQDLSAIYSAFKNDDFKNMNIFSNRIMTDALFGNDDRFALMGFFLKDMALIYDSMKAKKELTTFSTAKSFGDVFIKSIVDVDVENDKLWGQYHQFRNSINQHIQNEHEKGNYEGNIEFTHSAFIWLINMLKREKDMLFIDKNQFLRGILNEMNRIFKVHGGRLSELYAMCLLGALRLYYEYMDYFGETKNEIIKNSIIPYVNAIVEAVEKDPVDQKEVTTLVLRIIFDWRYSYIRFMERPKFIPITEAEVPISEETKKKISETVTKVLEEEVK